MDVHAMASALSRQHKAEREQQPLEVAESDPQLPIGEKMGVQLGQSGHGRTN